MTTSTATTDTLHWPNIDTDVKTSVQSYLVFLLSTRGETLPRPLGQEIHVERIEKAFHIDYLHIGESSTEDEYILVLKDNFSGYVLLEVFKAANAEITSST